MLVRDDVFLKIMKKKKFLQSKRATEPYTVVRYIESYCNLYVHTYGKHITFLFLMGALQGGKPCGQVFVRKASMHRENRYLCLSVWMRE
jgi:hypothetical protein